MKQPFAARKLCVLRHGPSLFAFSPHQSLLPASSVARFATFSRRSQLPGAPRELLCSAAKFRRTSTPTPPFIQFAWGPRPPRGRLPSSRFIESAPEQPAGHPLRRKRAPDKALRLPITNRSERASDKFRLAHKLFGTLVIISQNCVSAQPPSGDEPEASSFVETRAFLNTYQPRGPAGDPCSVCPILLKSFYAESPLSRARVVVRGVHGVSILDTQLKLHRIALRDVGQRGRGEAEVSERD